MLVSRSLRNVQICVDFPLWSLWEFPWSDALERLDGPYLTCGMEIFYEEQSEFPRSKLEMEVSGWPAFKPYWASAESYRAIYLEEYKSDAVCDDVVNWLLNCSSTWGFL